MFIPKPTIDLILQLPAHEVIERYVKLKQAGASFSGLCPFHNEKSPSFYVTPAKGIYKCFGCGEAGNVIQFVMKQVFSTLPANEAFTSAAKKICDDHGIMVAASEGNITKTRVEPGTVKDFAFLETPLTAALLQTIISKKVWEPKAQGDADTHFDKIIAVCREYGLRGVDEFSFTKMDDNVLHQVKIKATPSQPLFLFEME